jgi:hypothetical protein
MPRGVTGATSSRARPARPWPRSEGLDDDRIGADLAVAEALLPFVRAGGGARRPRPQPEASKPGGASDQLRLTYEERLQQRSVREGARFVSRDELEAATGAALA